MAKLTPFFILPLARVERMRETACVDGAVISVEVVCDVGGSQRLLAIANARVRQPATPGVWEGTLEGARQRWVDGGRFPDEKNPAIVLPAVVCVWVRDGGADLFGRGIVEGRGGRM